MRPYENTLMGLALLFKINADPAQATKALEAFSRKTEALTPTLMTAAGGLFQMVTKASEVPAKILEASEWTGRKPQGAGASVKVSIAEELAKGPGRTPGGIPAIPPEVIAGQQTLTDLMLKSVHPISAQRQALLSLNDALAGTKTSMQAMSGEMQVAFEFQKKFGSALGASIGQAIVYGESVGKAMDRALKATLASIAGQAMVRAIFETAVGFADLFVDPPAAAAAFESAALFAAVGAAAGAIGAAIPGGRHGRGAGGREGAYGGGGGAGAQGLAAQPGGGPGIAPTLAGGAQFAPSGGGLVVAIMGNEEAGQWLATTLNRAVSQQGVQLVSSGSQRSAPVGH